MNPISLFKDELNKVFSGEWYCVNNYGYGDGAFYGPYDAANALNQFYFHSCQKVKENTTLEDLMFVFKSALKSKTHYISDSDRHSVGFGQSECFGDTI